MRPTLSCRYGCKFDHGLETEEARDSHEKFCPYNPVMRSCKTCEHEIPGAEKNKCGEGFLSRCKEWEEREMVQ